ncbi:MAG: carboxypeptidase-like regulatory domain-containing protein [Acidobacteria bacterium]|nr:carboxypeptidase-like regulatory domain-containing protein [Acidobacteriota bacterium]
MINKKRIVALVFACLSVLICLHLFLNSDIALAQKDPGNLDIRTSVAQKDYNALRELPVMVSVIKDGELLMHRESQFNANVSYSLPAGIYDIRVEGDGMLTLVKRGILVKAGETTEIIGGPMRVGTGVKIIEYATGGLSREEIAARLAKLEANVAELQKARQTK